MGVTAIGASVKRTEDIRFITGKGRYVDDVNRAGQAYAYFLRSPHAHAAIDKIDTSAALKSPGVVAILTGDDIAADKVGGLICGWMIYSKDGSPMKAGAHPALAQGKVRHVGDHVAVVIAETLAQARDAAEKIEVHYSELPAVVDTATAASPGQPQLHEVAPNNTIFNWHIGDKAMTEAAFASAAHVTKIDLLNNRLIPNAMEPRAAVAEYDSGTDAITLFTTSQNPHVARLVLSAFVGLAPEHKLRVIAPDVGGGFGSKIFIYPEETVCAWAAKKIDRAVKWTAESTKSFSRGCAWPRSCDPCGTCARRRGEDHRPARPHDRQSRRLYVDLLVVSADVPLWPPAVGPVRHSEHLLRGGRSLHQYRAGRRLPRRGPAGSDASSSSASSNSPPARRGRDSAEFRRQNFVKSFPHQTPVLLNYDVGDYPKALDKALELADYKGVAQRKAASAAKGKLRGVGISAYIEACGLAPSRAVGSLGAGVGLWESAEVRVNPVGTVEVLTGSHSHGQSHETTFAQLVSDRLGIPMENVSIVHGDTDKVQFGMGTYGSRSGAVGMAAISKALDKIEAKAKKVAGHVLEASEGGYRVQGREVHCQGHRQIDRLRLGGAERLYRAQVRRTGTGTRPEGDRLLGSDQFHLPGRRPHLRTRNRSGDRRRDDRPVDRGRRFRQTHQSYGRRGSGSRRHRAGRRPGASREARITTARDSC